MENTNYSNTLSDEELKINESGNNFLSTAAKWAKFLAIFNLSIMVFAILFMSIMAYAVPYARIGFSMIFMYIVIFGIAAIPLYFLYQFSTKTKSALWSKDDNTLVEGLAALKNYFLIQGIFAIVAIVFMIIAIVILLTLGSRLMNMGLMYGI